MSEDVMDTGLGLQEAVDDHSTSAALKVGKILEIARSKRRWEIKDVATRLKLGSDVIAGLEEEGHDGVLPRPFIRGYIRSYAKLLELDGPALVMAWELENPKLEKSTSPIFHVTGHKMGRMERPGRSSRKSAGKKVGLVILFLVLCLFGLWFISTSSLIGSTKSDVVVMSPTLPLASGTQAALPIVVQPTTIKRYK